jgi:hypothetical protein
MPNDIINFVVTSNLHYLKFLGCCSSLAQIGFVKILAEKIPLTIDFY